MLSPSLKILVVDDQRSMRVLTCGVLRGMGFKNYREAEHGRQALKILGEWKADVVLTDWNMPTMDGLELLNAIQADSTLKDIPVIMLTATATPIEVKEATKAGVRAYVVKPFKGPTIYDKLEQLFSP